ncbi:TIGR03086 family metal-binding protein [Amycolatopsis minnesotensis]
MTTTTDPRPLYDRALTWVRSLATGLPAELSAPTPCAEFDVRTLLGHLVATVDRARVVGEGGDVFSCPLVVTGVEDWPGALAGAAEKMQAVWQDDAVLDREVTVPWGKVSGRAALWGYLNEALVHGWDLAVAIGADEEADPELAEAALTVAKQFIPAEHRGDQIPFAPVVAPRPGAGPTERLANWSGHHRQAG